MSQRLSFGQGRHSRQGDGPSNIFRMIANIARLRASYKVLTP
ncbi:hypothetical protein PSCLAVI8L_200094 [Pseudoclavibacter sp. 8L]|nr:hypothetical protein PSCLAVI8L_200094 [Pseudoclavibacter sp. 8L]